MQTKLDDICLAFAPYKKMLLAGVGKALRLYELGKKMLLRKAENKVTSLLLLLVARLLTSVLLVSVVPLRSCSRR